MKLLEKLCKELGVEVGEKWTANDGKSYVISKDGELYNRDYAALADISRLLTGKIKPVWIPKKGDKYCVPDLSSEESFRYDSLYWAGDEFDKWVLENNLVFKTKEGAIEATNKILKVLKED